MLVEVGPAGLDDADFGVSEVVNGLAEEVCGNDEISIEDGDDEAGGGFQTGLQSPCLVAVAILAVVVFDGMAHGAVFGHQAFGEGMGFVGGIVQDLNLQEMAGVVHLDDLIDEAFDDVTLVVERELNGNGREFGEQLRGRGKEVFAVLEVAADNLVAVDAVEGENEKNGEIGDEQRIIERGKLMDAGEGIVEKRSLETVERGRISD